MDLLSRCRAGEPAAWEELWETHWPAVFRFVYQLSGGFTREDAEEICQEAFVAVVRGIESFDGRSAFQTWLFRIASNKALDFRAKAAAAKRGSGIAPVPLDDPEHAPAVADGAAERPGTGLERAENAAMLREALDHVGDACREVIELRYFGDLSYEEIATELKMNPKTVSSRLSKCLDRLGEIARRVFSAGNAVHPPV